MNDYEDFYFDETEEEKYYRYFPEIDKIYNENILLDTVPDYFKGKQKKLFKDGIKQINSINKKYGCNFSFNKIIDSLDTYFINMLNHKPGYKLQENTHELDRITLELAIEMERKNSYCCLSQNKHIENLKRNYKEISKVVGLYVKLNPGIFPVEGRKNDAVFDSRGRLRSEFKMPLGTNLDDISKELQSDARKIYEKYTNGIVDSAISKDDLVDKVKDIIAENDDNVTKLAKCVRLLRPLQASRERRSRFEYFTNHDIYVAERDALRQCKEEMKRLGLDRKEISKVLHGKAFNDVKFNDGMTVREKNVENYRIAFEERDALIHREEEKHIAIEHIKIDANEKQLEEKNVNKIAIVIDEINDDNIILDNQIEENSKVKSIDTNLSK